ncbi:unnamed protein product [Pneumocystis jirovecii]|uniref:Uncharacterized protein n=1 Tax=Pneumocystis jirovecii TaxID=42068 RepID=L0P7Z5_PNEJI|nr:unnamed protein product [Pneumocystis jirovecii]
MKKWKKPFLGLNFKKYRISIAGIKNANVFPLPVFAAPRTSLPAIKIEKPISASALAVGFESERSENITGFDEFNVTAVSGATVEAGVNCSFDNGTFDEITESTALTDVWSTVLDIDLDTVFSFAKPLERVLCCLDDRAIINNKKEL